MYFAPANFKILKEKNPDLKITEGAKLNGKVWAEMDEKAKKKYNDLHDQD